MEPAQCTKFDVTCVYTMTGECMGEIRLVGVNASQGRGELQYLYEDQEWARVCSGAVGILDAQTACQYLGFPLLSRVGTVYE